MSAFEEFVGTFQDEPLQDVVRIGRRYFYDPQHLSADVKEHGWEAAAVGIFLGEERGRFRPSPALLDMLDTERKVVVDEKAAEQFLYGKDVLMKGVEKGADGQVLVTDTDGNVLGYGSTVGSLDRQKGDRVFVRNLLDRGDYLRREK